MKRSRGRKNQNPELLYTWSNHGVSVSQIEAIQVTDGRDISLIYQDYRGANYLKLMPTTDEVEIQEIIFAVDSIQSQKYQAVVAAYNKKYPAYRIQMQTYGINDTGLLTELIAGKGPVMMDTSLVGFEDHAEWWQPLDEELIPQVINTGKINGTLYGVVTNL